VAKWDVYKETTLQMLFSNIARLQNIQFGNWYYEKIYFHHMVGLSAADTRNMWIYMLQIM